VFRVLDLGPDGRPVVREGDDMVAPAPPNTVRWIDLVNPDAAALALLKERFEFHPLALDDCASYGRQSKIDDYERYLFVVVNGFTADPTDQLEIQIHELHCFLGDGYLVTVHDNPLPAAERVWERAGRDRQVLERGPGWILYLQIAAMVEAAEPLVERITDAIDGIERRVIEEEGDIDLTPVFAIKRTTVAMRRVIRPLRDVLALAQRRTDRRIGPRSALHLRDVGDQVARIAEMVEETREVSTSVINAYQALQSSKTNEVVKKLTVFSAVFLPLSFIVGFWGQNFTDLPYQSPFWLGVMLASLVLVPAGLMEWFRRNLFR
jgi:magnesium transporter